MLTVDGHSPMLWAASGILADQTYDFGFGGVVCSLESVNLVLHFTEPSVPAFLVVATFVAVYTLQRPVKHPFARQPFGHRDGLAFRRQFEGWSSMSRDGLSRKYFI
jgi:hypothetical protein